MAHHHRESEPVAAAADAEDDDEPVVRRDQISNIPLLGSDARTYATTYGDFNNNIASVDRADVSFPAADPNLANHHFSFGDADSSEQYATSSLGSRNNPATNMDASARPPDPARPELQKSHFKIGSRGEEKTWETAAKTDYVPHDVSQATRDNDTSLSTQALQKTHTALGSAKTEYNTTNGEFRQFTREELEPRKIYKPPPENTENLFGSATNDWRTAAQDQFQPFPPDQVRREEPLGKRSDVAKHAFAFGDGSRTWTTSSQELGAHLSKEKEDGEGKK